MKAMNLEQEQKFVLKLMRYRDSNYGEVIVALEAVLAKAPPRLRIELIGAEDIPPDMALLIRSVLQERAPQTEVITYARSSLRGNAVLVWLQGARRFIRKDARLFFRRPQEGPGDAESCEDEGQWQERETPSLEELWEPGDEVQKEDYRRVVELIGEYLPVDELAGKQIGFKTMKQFRLVDSEGFDRVLVKALLTPTESVVGTAKRRQQKTTKEDK